MNQEIMESAVRLRRYLHTIPEPAFAETKTKAALMAYCRETAEMEKLCSQGNASVNETDIEAADTPVNDIVWEAAEYLANDTAGEDAAKNPEEYRRFEVVDRGSWFYCVWHGTDPAAIALRADFDAVTGGDGSFGHFCGHDGHSATLAGFGRMLALELRPERDVYLIFQPAEETGQGAAVCRTLLEEADIREIYGFHNIPGAERGVVLLLDGTFACASTGVEIELTGTPAHAAYPGQGRNPAAALAELILFMNAEIAKPHRGIILGTVIGADIGSAAFGVSASRGVLRLTLRGEYQDEYDAFVKSITDRAEQLAAEQGMTCEIRYVEPFPATENHHECVLKVAEAARLAGVPAQTPAEPFRWSEDFGWYLQKCPGAFFGIGSGRDHPGLHTSCYEFPDEIIATAWSVYRMLIQGQVPD